MKMSTITEHRKIEDTTKTTDLLNTIDDIFKDIDLISPSFRDNPVGIALIDIEHAYKAHGKEIFSFNEISNDTGKKIFSTELITMNDGKIFIHEYVDLLDDKLKYANEFLINLITDMD